MVDIYLTPLMETSQLMTDEASVTKYVRMTYGKTVYRLFKRFFPILKRRSL